jgi:hypothetical protein
VFHSATHTGQVSDWRRQPWLTDIAWVNGRCCSADLFITEPLSYYTLPIAQRNPLVSVLSFLSYSVSFILLMLYCLALKKYIFKQLSPEAAEQATKAALKQYRNMKKEMLADSSRRASSEHLTEGAENEESGVTSSRAGLLFWLRTLSL